MKSSDVFDKMILSATTSKSPAFASSQRVHTNGPASSIDKMAIPLLESPMNATNKHHKQPARRIVRKWKLKHRASTKVEHQRNEQVLQITAAVRPKACQPLSAFDASWSNSLPSIFLKTAAPTLPLNHDDNLMSHPPRPPLKMMASTEKDTISVMPSLSCLTPKKRTPVGQPGERRSCPSKQPKLKMYRSSSMGHHAQLFFMRKYAQTSGLSHLRSD